MENNDNIVKEIYKELLKEANEKLKMRSKNISRTIFVAYLYTLDSKPYKIDNNKIKEFLGEARPILVTETEDTNYVRELRTGKLFPIAYIEREDVWTSSYIKYSDASVEHVGSNQYVVTSNLLPYKRLATLTEVYKYYTVVGDKVINSYLEPINRKNKQLTK